MENPVSSSRQKTGDFLLGNLFILIATIFFGVNVPVSKMLIPHWLTAEDITVVRIFGGGVLLWIASLFLKTEPIERADRLKVFLGGAVGLFSFLYLFNTSLRYGDPIDISIIMTFPPIFVILIGIIFQHHKASMLEILGVITGFLGAALVIIFSQSTPDKGSDNLLGIGLALCSTICYAFYLVILEGPTKKYHPVSLLRWVFLSACVPLLAICWSFPKAPLFHTSEATPWLCAGFVLIFVTVVSYFLINPAIKLIGSELVSMYQYLLPVFAAIASMIMGIAKIHAIQVVAMLVIIIGMIMTNIAKRRKSTVTPPVEQ